MISATEAGTARATATDRISEKPIVKTDGVGASAVTAAAAAYKTKPAMNTFFLPRMSPSLPPKMVMAANSRANREMAPCSMPAWVLKALTNALVAIMFGTRYLGMLGGIVFLSHQIGSFLGVWLGGYLYDIFGTYDPVWWLGVALGLFAAVVHWPIRERPVERPALVAAE